MDTIKVYGTTWCPDCHRAKRVLDREQAPYQFINIDQDQTARSFVEQVNRGMRSVPTIVFPDGSILVEPRDDTLSAHLKPFVDK